MRLSTRRLPDVHGADGLSQAIAEHVATTAFERLAESTVVAARRALLDGVGVMLAASGSCEEVQPFARVAMAAGPGPATLLGYGTRVQPAMAALVNGAMGHALDFEDVLDAGPAHPNVSLLPAALAMCEAASAPVSGRELIAAIAIGGDLGCRMTFALTRPMEDAGWFPPPILAAFGSTAAAARVAGLTPREVLDAFSLLMCQNVCPGEIKNAPGTVLRAVREAFPAQAAVISVALAREGVRGFDAPIEGESGFFRSFAGGHYDPAALLTNLGSSNAIDALSFKPWPACRGTHAFIESVEVLRAAHDLTVGDIRTIDAIGGPVQRMLIAPIERKRAPATAIDAKFSIPFCVGAALTQRSVDLDTFAPARLSDPDILTAAALVHFDEQGDWPRSRAAAGGLRIHLHDGRVLEHFVEQPRGHPDNPLDDEALIAKFVMCANHAAVPLAADEAQRLARNILTIDEAVDVVAHLGWRPA